MKIILASLIWCFCLTSVFIVGRTEFISVEEASLTASEYHERTKRAEVLCEYFAVFGKYRSSIFA